MLLKLCSFSLKKIRRTKRELGLSSFFCIMNQIDISRFHCPCCWICYWIIFFNTKHSDPDTRTLLSSTAGWNPERLAARVLHSEFSSTHVLRALSNMRCTSVLSDLAHHTHSCSVKQEYEAYWACRHKQYEWSLCLSVQTVDKYKPRFVALHFQEVGGKEYKDNMAHAENFFW